MVKDPRTSTRADQLRPLNTPRPVVVQVTNGLPVAVIDGEHQTTIERIQDRWHIDDEWWREPIRRRYYRVALETGRVRTLYHDQARDLWFEQGY
jgi:hypothetical protein